MAAAALVLYVLWAALAFGWRTIVQHRRTGDSGLRLHAPLWSLQWWAKLAFAVAIVIGFAAPIAAVASLKNVGSLNSTPLHVAGPVVTIAAIAFTLVAQLSLGESWRIRVDPNERTALVARGQYRYVRNPIFTVLVITAVGLAMMIPNIISIIGLVTLIAALEIQVRKVEEPYLLDAHSDTYRTYARTVGRFVPSIGELADEQ